MQVFVLSYFGQELIYITSPLHIGPLLEYDRIRTWALCSLPPHPIRPNEIKSCSEHCQERSVGHFVTITLTQ